MRLKIQHVSKCITLCSCRLYVIFTQITLIEHERRLIQFDSISSERAFSPTVSLCAQHLLNHIKLIQLEKCRSLVYWMYDLIETDVRFGSIAQINCSRCLCVCL